MAFFFGFGGALGAAVVGAVTRRNLTTGSRLPESPNRRILFLVSGFSIPRESIHARLLLTQGGERHGAVFVMARAPSREGPETPLEMLNRPEGFFPFLPDEQKEVLLVSRAQTIALTIAAGTGKRPPGAREIGLEVALVDGTVWNGVADVELPEPLSRPIDYLNAGGGPFFAVTTNHATHLVNRAHVLYARPTD